MAQTKLINVDTSKAQSNVKALDDGVKQLNKDLGTTNDAGKNIDAIGSSVSKATSNIGKSLTAATKDFQDLNKVVNDVKFDIGSIGPSVAKLGAGIAGGFNIVSGALKLMGNDSEETTKAITELQFFLQQIPLQLFAIAEGSQAIKNIWDAASEGFSKIFKFLDISKLSEMSKQLADIGGLLLKGPTSLPDTFLDLFKDVDEYNNFTLALNDFKKSLDGLDLSLDEQKAKLTEFASTYAKSFYETLGPIDKFKVQIRQLQKVYNGFTDSFAESLGVIEGANKGFSKFAVTLAKGLPAGIFTIIAAGIATITTGIIKLRKALNEVRKEQKEWLDLKGITGKGLQDAATEVKNIEVALYNVYNKSGGIKEQQKALGRLNELVPEFNGHLNNLTGEISGNTKALQEHIATLQQEAKAQAAISSIVDIEKKRIQAEQDIYINQEELLKTQEKIRQIQRQAYEEGVGLYSDAGVFVSGLTAPERDREKELNKAIDQAKKDADKYQKQIDWILENLYTNVGASVKKGGAGASAMAKAGETIKKEVIEALKPSKQELEVFTEDWIGNIPLTETGQLLAKRIQNEINLTGIGDSDPLTVKVNIAVGDFPENERLRQYLDFITESQRQLAVLNDTMSRFGESSLGLTGSWQNVVSDFSNTFAQLANNIAKGENSFSSWSQMAASGIQSVGTLLNALSDEQDSSTKQGFEAQKKYQISATVMNTLAGIINAWSSALAITPPIGPILGATNSAMIAALGAVQIAKIKNQRFGEEGNVSSSTINSTLIAPTQYSQAVQNANIESRLGDNRVWVSETDISRVQDRVKVQESENTY